MSVYGELKRRGVIGAGAAYAVLSWLILQIADVILGNLAAPSWIFLAILLAVVIGFPVVLLLAWLFEFTPDGVRREPDYDKARPRDVGRTSHALAYFVAGALLASIAIFVARQQTPDDKAFASIDLAVDRPAVLVLPFENATANPAQDYLAFGLTDEVITGLLRYKDFPVVSRTASLEFRRGIDRAAEFAESVGAAYWIEGSVHVGEDGLRVRSTMSRTDGEQVWAERLQHESGNDGMLEIADTLVSRAAHAVMQSEIKRVQRSAYPPGDAWEHYVKGLQGLLDYDHAAYEPARHHLDQAVGIAPDMAEAWWAIGELEVMHYIATSGLEETSLEPLETIIGYFARSHALSPFQAAACGCLGYMLSAVGRTAEAQAIFAQALDANPLSVDLRLDYASFLLREGRFEEAMENSDLALRLGADSVDRATVWVNRAVNAFYSGNEEEALSAVNKAVVDARSIFNMPTEVALLYALGQEQAALRHFRLMDESFPGISARNPVLRVTLDPVDRILAAQDDSYAGPRTVAEIFSRLRAMD